VKKKLRQKKLVLDLETIKALTHADLKNVNGRTSGELCQSQVEGLTGCLLW
jgi:hypothetical protein